MIVEKTEEVRRFAVKFKLKAGVGNEAVVFLEGDAVQAIRGWIDARATAGKKFLIGRLTVGAGGKLLRESTAPESREFDVEYKAEFGGTLLPLIDDFTENEVLEVLTDLAEVIAKRFLQDRVEVEFCGKLLTLRTE